MVVEAGRGGADALAEAQHDALLVRLHAVEAAQHPDGEQHHDDQQDADAPAPAAGPARHTPAQPVLQAPDRFLDIRGLRAAGSASAAPAAALIAAALVAAAAPGAAASAASPGTASATAAPRAAAASALIMPGHGLTSRYRSARERRFSAWRLIEQGARRWNGAAHPES